MSDIANTDDVTKDAAEFLKILAQILVLIALRARQHGDREARAIAAAERIRMKEARELMLREARENKARDPRNTALARMCELGREKFFATKPVRTSPPVVIQKPPPVPMRWDSNERREHLQAYVSRIAPEMEQVRMLHDIGQAKPGYAAVDRRPEAGSRRAAEARERDARELERQRERTRTQW